MKKGILGLAGLAFLTMMSSCSSFEFVSDMDKTADFTNYKTFQYYGWAEESNKILNQLEQGRIESAFAVEFDKRNLDLVEDGGDLLVTLFIVTEQKTRSTATTTNMGGYSATYGYGGWYGHGPAYGWGGGTSHTTFNEYDYTVGTLVIDIYDIKEKRLVFESVAKGETHENPKNQEARLAKIAARMMKDFPIEPVE